MTIFCINTSFQFFATDLLNHPPPCAGIHPLSTRPHPVLILGISLHAATSESELLAGHMSALMNWVSHSTEARLTQNIGKWARCRITSDFSSSGSYFFVVCASFVVVVVVDLCERLMSLALAKQKLLDHRRLMPADSSSSLKWMRPSASAAAARRRWIQRRQVDGFRDYLVTDDCS